MKKIVSYAIVIMLLFSAEIVLGQGYTFRVLANKGTNKVKKASGELVALKTGATLNSGDALVASEGAYIGLMHKSGKTIEVRKAGTMQVSDLEKSVNTGQSSVASRYAKFVSDKMNEEQAGTYRSRLNATGAVSRAVADGSLKVMLPNSVEVISGTAIVRWESAVENATYVVTVKNIFDEVILSQETNKTSIELNFDAESMKNEAGLYIFSVKDKNDQTVASGDIGIKRIKDAGEIKTDLEGLRAEVSEDSPLNKLIYASFFEEKGLLLDALTKYEEAIQMAPEIEDFQELYKNFLITNGLSEE